MGSVLDFAPRNQRWRLGRVGLVTDRLLNVREAQEGDPKANGFGLCGLSPYSEQQRGSRLIRIPIPSISG